MQRPAAHYRDPQLHGPISRDPSRHLKQNCHGSSEVRPFSSAVPATRNASASNEDQIHTTDCSDVPAPIKQAVCIIGNPGMRSSTDIQGQRNPTHPLAAQIRNQWQVLSSVRLEDLEASRKRGAETPDAAESAKRQRLDTSVTIQSAPRPPAPVPSTVSLAQMYTLTPERGAVGFDVKAIPLYRVVRILSRTGQVINPAQLNNAIAVCVSSFARQDFASGGCFSVKGILANIANLGREESLGSNQTPNHATSARTSSNSCRSSDPRVFSSLWRSAESTA